MAKFFGKVGYGIPIEIAIGVWDDGITVKEYSGDVLRNSRKLTIGNNVNSDVNVSNEISIVADPFANENFHAIRYIEYMGTLWTVLNVEVQYPRLILGMGGVYNGPKG